MAEIHDAIRKGDLDAVGTILSNNPDLVSSRDNDGSRPLDIAVFDDNAEMARLLLTHGADLNAPGWKGHSALELAKVNQQKKVLEVLLQALMAQTRAQPQGSTASRNATRPTVARLGSRVPADLGKSIKEAAANGKGDTTKQLIERCKAYDDGIIALKKARTSTRGWTAVAELLDEAINTWQLPERLKESGRTSNARSQAVPRRGFWKRLFGSASTSSPRATKPGSRSKLRLKKNGDIGTLIDESGVVRGLLFQDRERASDAQQISACIAVLKAKGETIEDDDGAFFTFASIGNLRLADVEATADGFVKWFPSVSSTGPECRKCGKALSPLKGNYALVGNNLGDMISRLTENSDYPCKSCGVPFCQDCMVHLQKKPCPICKRPIGW